MFSNDEFLTKYITALIDNADLSNTPRDIDIIFDGGAFNGVFGQGIATYLNELENRDKIKIHRISGCSIGAFIALIYATKQKYDFESGFVKVSDHFKKFLNLSEFAREVKEYIFDTLDDGIIKSLNQTLHISYYDLKLRKQIVVNEFVDKNHLYDCILRSSHIPYVSNVDFAYDERYVDGITPHIFRDGERDALFISLMTPRKLSRLFVSQNEVNSNSRMLTGLADADEFFTTGKSDMCSWVKNWRLPSFLLLRLRELVCFLVIWLFSICMSVKNLLPHYINDTFILHGIVKVVQAIYSDVFYTILS